MAHQDATAHQLKTTALDRGPSEQAICIYFSGWSSLSWTQILPFSLTGFGLPWVIVQI